MTIPASLDEFERRLLHPLVRGLYRLTNASWAILILAGIAVWAVGIYVFRGGGALEIWLDAKLVEWLRPKPSNR